MDLMVMTKEGTRNKNFNYGFVAIDIYSRYGYCIPIKQKTAKDCGEALEKVIKNFPFELETITTDDGKEYRGYFETVVDKNSIIHGEVEPEDHHAMGIVDAFIKNLRRRILKVWLENENVDWVSHIDTIVKDYNNTIHSTIKAKPIDILNGEEIPARQNNLHIEELKIGDNVRTMIKKDKFDKKSSTQNYSSEVYKIKEQDGNKYILEGRPERWALWELQKTDFKPSESKQRIVMDTQHEIKEKAKQKRFLAKEDLVLIPSPIREKRERKAPERYGFSGSGYSACKF